MGLFSKKKTTDIFAPVDGEIIDLTSVDDPVFAEKMIGDGFAFYPESGDFYAPVEGKLVTVFATGHAYGIANPSGFELLLHIGIDTVSLNGQGFDIKVKQDQTVKVGDHLVTVDLDYVKQNVPSIQTPIVFIRESMEGKKIEILKSGKVKKGDLVARVS